jgi:two-component system, cell cycle sensor histidine kinase and response regulator CckA
MGVIRQTFPKNIEIEEVVAADLWLLEANPTQLHQLFLNLCVNARDAMPRGGALRFVASNTHLDRARSAELKGTQPGRYLIFEVSDTGSGISPENMARIWEPFFTTKEVGSGTGLGLPTVQRIVELHHGAITIRSAANSGTAFTVYLPAATLGESTASGMIETSAPRGNGELVLVVDDDPGVRELTAALLTKHGYRVRVASNGTEAVELLMPRLDEIRLVITDLGMPRLDGFALVNVVRNLNSSISILAMSGIAYDEKQRHDQPLPCPVLNKPFTADSLLNAVHDLVKA